MDATDGDCFDGGRDTKSLIKGGAIGEYVRTYRNTSGNSKRKHAKATQRIKDIWPGVKAKELRAITAYASKILDLKKKWRRNPDYIPSDREIPKLPGM